jgi:hypothetical protein
MFPGKYLHEALTPTMLQLDLFDSLIASEHNIIATLRRKYIRKTMLLNCSLRIIWRENS